MTLYVPHAPVYTWRLDSYGSLQPGSNLGTSITPSGTANTYTSYTQIISGASVTEDVWFIEINVNTVAVSAAARDMIATIGLDKAGGTSYTDTINHLLVSSASTYLASGGVWYSFPLFIPAGTSIGIKVSQNSTNTTAIRAFVRLYGSPTHPEITPVGHFVETIGAVTASSRGTTVTPGTVAEGSWTSLGSTTNATWWHQTGYGTNDTTMSAAIVHMDLSSDSSGNNLLISDYPILTTTGEAVIQPRLTSACARPVAGGTTLYGRMRNSTTPDSNVSMAAYCLGG